MSLDHIQKTDFSSATEPNFSVSLLSFSPDEIRQLNSRADKTAPQALQGDRSDKKAEHFSAAPSDKAETEQGRMDERIKRAFGKETMNHIKDHDWLISHADDLKTGFNRVFDGRGEEFTVGQIAARLKELSGGLIYGESSDGSKNPFTSTPADKHFQVFLKRTLFDTQLFHQVTSYVGPGLDRTIRR